MQTVFTITITCDPADADEVRNVAHRTIDYINESLYDASRSDANGGAQWLSGNDSAGTVTLEENAVA